MQNPLSKFIPHLVGEYPKNFLNIYEKINISENADHERIKTQVWQAYEFASRHHEGQKRRSGKPYFEHCEAVAESLAEWNMDPVTVMCGLLHDTVEDTDANFDDIRRLFGEDAAELVNGVTKLGGMVFSSREAKQAGNFMKLLLSVAKDLRVIIIKFADRIHNMQTIQYMTKIKRHRIAVETRDIYVPLAHRLGMAKIKWTLEDLVFQTLNPGAYKDIDSKLKSSKRERKKIINQVLTPIHSELDNYKIKANIFGRIKSHASIYGKMVQRGKTFEEIYDLYAIRIILDKVEECYLALGIIHNLFGPVQERFKDFIARPKGNGYQSIHTTIMTNTGKMLEVQIRTKEMDQTAEIGVAAHWHYKEGTSGPEHLDSEIKWLRELVEILQSETADPREFMNLLKIDLFNDEIFVFTPSGDLIQLPLNAMPIDFAFAIHSEVGLRCLGVKVNHKVVPLNTKLNSGDTVEIITSKTQQPSYGWLKLCVTTKARNHINRYLKKIHHSESVKMGNEILEKTLRRLKVYDLLTEAKVAYDKFGYSNEDMFMEAIGNGSLAVRDIIRKIKPKAEDKFQESEDESKQKFLDFARLSAKGIRIGGITNVMVNFGKCCNPIPGDEMVGYVTRGRGVTVHRTNCTTLPLLQEESDRIIPVEWDVGRDDVFSVRVKIVAEDNRGRLREISETITKLNVNITSVDLKVKDNISTAYFIFSVKSNKQLTRIIRKLSAIPGVDYVERTNQ